MDWTLKDGVYTSDRHWRVYRHEQDWVCEHPGGHFVLHPSLQTAQEYAEMSQEIADDDVAAQEVLDKGEPPPPPQMPPFRIYDGGE